MILAAGLESPAIAWSDLAPLLVLLGGTCALLLMGSLLRGWKVVHSTTVAVLSSGAAAVVSMVKWADLHTEGPATIVSDAISVDRFAVFGAIVVCLAVALGSLLVGAHMVREQGEGPELHALLLSSAIGALVMVAANDLIVLFLGLEVLSLSLYLLAASNRRREQSQEAGLKYFVLGGFSSAFFLYGIALVYGATGSTNIGEIATAVSSNVLISGRESLLLVGVGLLMVGLGFKVSAVPFQVWTPDVYEGAPSPVTAFMASVGKIAAFGAMLRVLVTALDARVDDWRPVVWALAVATVLVGSTMAVVQTNVKRMLAYSSISHAGFVLVGVEAAGHRAVDGISAAMTYLSAYAVLVLGSFAVVMVVSGRGDGATELADFRGLASRRPLLALAFSVLLLAQAGVPLTSGFVAKFAVIKSAVDVESYAVALVAMVGAVIAAYLYLRIMVSMWLDEAGDSPEPLPVAPAVGAVIALCVGFTLVVGLFPSLLLDVTGLVGLG